MPFFFISGYNFSTTLKQKKNRMCFSDVTLVSPFSDNSHFLAGSILFYLLFTVHQITSVLVLREKSSLKHLLHLFPDPSTPNIFTIQKTYITLLNIDHNKLVPVESPSDTIVLGC